MNKVRSIYLYICLTVVILAGVGLFAFKPFTASAEETHDHTNWSKISTNSLPSNTGSYYLTKDVAMSSSWNVPKGEVNLCLNGYGISGNSSSFKITVQSGATLNIYDCIGSGSVTSSTYGGTITVDAGGTLNIYGGTFSNTYDESGSCYCYIE